MSNFIFFSNVRNSRARNALWPIRSHELSKFMPLAILMLLILLNSNLTRIIKDSYVVTVIGTEVLSFIKIWVETPVGILFVMLYMKLCNVMTTERVFRLVVSFFIIFFASFAFIIYPNRELLHPDPQYINSLIYAMPYLKWWIVMWSQWSFVLFYLMAELWRAIVSMLFFWQLANKIIKTEEAKRFYVYFGIFGQFNLILTGWIVSFIVSQNKFFSEMFGAISDDSELILKPVTLMIIFAGVLCLILQKYIEVTEVRPRKSSAMKNNKTDILKLTIRQSAKMVLSSRYLAGICILMIAYSTSINLIEGVWMSRAKALYPSTKDFMVYQSEVLQYTGYSTLFFILIGGVVLRKIGWFTTAAIPPVMILIFGTLFFCSVIFQDSLEYILPSFIYFSPLAIVVCLGGLQNILGKGSKYSLFDATKEMAFIPLDHEMKTKGKAAVDILGTNLGKVIGAGIQMVIFTIFPFANHEDISGFLMVLFIMVCISWLMGLSIVNKEYKNKLK